MFAGNTKIYSQIKIRNDQEELQNNILEACNWAARWHMSFSAKKCTTLHVGKNNLDQEKDLRVIHDKKIEI